MSALSTVDRRVGDAAEPPSEGVSLFAPSFDDQLWGVGAVLALVPGRAPVPTGRHLPHPEASVVDASLSSRQESA